MLNIPRKLHIDDAQGNPELTAMMTLMDVKVNGREVGICKSYDMDAGTVERFAAGFMMSPEGWRTETLTGNVEVTIRDE
jgi:hypothetical protein